MKMLNVFQKLADDNERNLNYYLIFGQNSFVIVNAKNTENSFFFARPTFLSQEKKWNECVLFICALLKRCDKDMKLSNW